MNPRFARVAAACAARSAIIMAGTLDGASGLGTAAHIFVEHAGDYYGIDDGVPQHEGGDHGVVIPKA